VYIQQLVYVMLKIMELVQLLKCRYEVVKSVKHFVSKISDYVTRF